MIALFLIDLPCWSLNFTLLKASIDNRVFIIFTQDYSKWHQSVWSQMVSYLYPHPCEKPCEYRLLVSWNSLSAVLKYKRNDDDETLKEKFSRLNIHSISKKSKRVTSHLKILTGGEPQVLTYSSNCRFALTASVLLLHWAFLKTFWKYSLWCCLFPASFIKSFSECHVRQESSLWLKQKIA